MESLCISIEALKMKRPVAISKAIYIALKTRFLNTLYVLISNTPETFQIFLSEYSYRNVCSI